MRMKNSHARTKNCHTRFIVTVEEVRILTEQMSQPNQSNGRAEVSRVFGRSQDGQGNPSSSINQNLPHYNISVSSQ